MSDARDPLLSALYRASATETPPSRVDAAVLAAARAAVRPSKPARSGWSWFPASWAVPVSVAAVVVMAVSVTLLHQEHEPAPMPKVAGEGVRKAAEPPAAAEASPGPAGTAAAPARKDEAAEQLAVAPSRESERASDGPRDAGRAERARAEESLTAVRRAQSVEPAAEPSSPPMAPAVAAPAPPASPHAATGRIAENVATSGPVGEAPAASRPDSAADRRAAAETTARARMRRDDAAVEGVPGGIASQSPRTLYKVAPKATAEAEDVDRKASPSATATSSAPASAEARRPAPAAAAPQPPADMTPEQWIEHIERLRREGRTAEAEKSLEEFRRRHPSHPLPRHLQ